MCNARVAQRQSIELIPRRFLVRIQARAQMRELKKLVGYIVKQGLLALRTHAPGSEFRLDYLAIFCRDGEEYEDLVGVVESLGKEVRAGSVKTGKTFLLREALPTDGGFLRLIKIRKPDASRPQRGAPDFKVENYVEFKEKYLRSSGDFTLMIRKDYEMIELKGIDVLVYIPDRTLGDRLGLHA